MENKTLKFPTKIPTKQIFLIGGLPGSGKTTQAERIVENLEDVTTSFAIFEADDFFLDANGNYKFHPELIHHAHELCQKRTEQAMLESTDLIIVANTFTRKWERQPYEKLAARYGYNLVFKWIDSGLSDEELAARNVHDVPVDVIAKMRARIE
jgi:predicted kinase